MSAALGGMPLIPVKSFFGNMFLATGLEGNLELWHEFVMFAARVRSSETPSAMPTM
jgi:hypothetical protein